MSIVCAHCHEKHACRPRGLCTACYANLGIRESHPPDGRYYFDNHKQQISPVLAEEPTQTRPGSEAKINIMRRRAANGRRIFHPGDRDLADEEGAADEYWSDIQPDPEEDD